MENRLGKARNQLEGVFKKGAYFKIRMISLLLSVALSTPTPEIPEGLAYTQPFPNPMPPKKEQTPEIPEGPAYTQPFPDPMPPKKEQAMKIPEGQALQCSKGGNEKLGAVYRFTKGQIRFYRDLHIAASWDLNWMASIYIDCTDLVLGANMLYKPSEGQAVRCSKGRIGEPEAIYRYSNYQIQQYSEVSNQNRLYAIKVDCSSFTIDSEYFLLE